MWYIPLFHRDTNVTVDEEISLLEDHLRRLKVEYDMYFGGGSHKVPADLDWRVQSLLKKYSDARKMNSTQRFRYNTIAQRYAVYSDLWRQKMKVREEGYRRPQDALLGIQGLRPMQGAAPADAPGRQSIVLMFKDGDESDGVRELYAALQRGGKAQGSFEAFADFLRNKTRQIQSAHQCPAVKYTVDVRDGRVRITATPFTLD